MLVHPQFDPVAIHLGPFGIHWYGLMYLLAFVCFIWLGRIRLRSLRITDWDNKFLDDLMFYGVLGVVLGGRLGEVLFYNPSYYFSHPFKILAVWEGGMSFHGGFLGSLAATALFARRHNIRWIVLLDFIAPLVPPGLAFGRIGNFINGELWGRPSDMPWAMIFPQTDNIPRHPSQLYEFALEGVALFAILWWFSRKRPPLGMLTGLGVAAYGAFRFLVEFTRNPDDGIFGLMTFGISMGQWLSLPMVLAGIALMIWSFRKQSAL